MIHRFDLLGCVSWGDFILHSGEKSNWICDLLIIRHKFNEIVNVMDIKHPLIGIELGGALLALTYSLKAGIIRKNGELYLPPYELGGRVTLIDDVVTTENSFREAESIVNKHYLNVSQRIVVLDRRKNKTLDIESLFTSQDLDLE